MDTVQFGIAAGVPFVLEPPAGGDPGAPVVLAWHLLDAPRNERSFAAALPLAGLEAWRVYLGLPMTGSRLPAGGWDELMRRGAEDGPVHVHGPISARAVAEAVPALADVRARFGLDPGAPLGLLGGSLGGSVALQLLADGRLDAAAAVVVSPMVQLRAVVELLKTRYGVDYAWTPESEAIANRLDFVARAAEVAAHVEAVQIVAGAEEDLGLRQAATACVEALRAAGAEAAHATVEDLAHPLAEGAGDEPTPQLPAVAALDAVAVDWFAARLRP